MTGVGGEARCAKKTVMPDINMPGGHDIGGKKQEIDLDLLFFFYTGAGYPRRTAGHPRGL